MPEFYDTHAHLDFPDFREDLAAVVDRALGAGITRILSVGTTLASSRRVVELADQFPSVYAIVGVHPNHVLEEPPEVRDELAALAGHPKVVALGETGLDYYRLHGSPDQQAVARKRQAAIFTQHLALAAELGLPCVIHQREAFRETLEHLVGTARAPRCVFHCFTGTADEARAVVSAGHCVSFTGIATFKSAVNVRDAIAATPLEAFMLETDCPFLAPVPHRGRRCEPAYVADLAPVVASVKGCTLEELSRATCDTARGFFTRLA